MRVARVQAQAKANLFLMVGPREKSGYHDLATLFIRLDLSDEIVVRAGGQVRALDARGPRLPAGGLGPPDKNLAYRAAAAYAERAGWPRGFAIELSKNIPVGGGLGGGSADAAAVLRALDALAERKLGSIVLLEIAARLGSDVPFLASEHVAAVGTGRGERLMPIAPLPPRDALVVAPRFSIPTADAYRWLDESRPAETKILDEESRGWFAGIDSLSRWEVHFDRGGLIPLDARNHFEPVVEARYPELRRIREELAAKGAKIARLAGSGSCVFGVFDDIAPKPSELAIDADVIATRTSARVVQVEVLE